MRKECDVASNDPWRILTGFVEHLEREKRRFAAATHRQNDTEATPNLRDGFEMARALLLFVESETNANKV